MNRHNRHSRFATTLMVAAMGTCMIEAAGATEFSAPRAPVAYITKEKSLVGNELHEAGVRVMYAGLPAENLEPTCDEGRARAEEYQRSNAERVARMVANNKDSSIADPSKFVAEFAKAMAEERAEHAAQMAQMLEMQQQSAVQLAQAAANMAALAAALTQNQAASPTPTPAPTAPTEEPKPVAVASADEKPAAGAEPTRRTRG